MANIHARKAMTIDDPLLMEKCREQIPEAGYRPFRQYLNGDMHQLVKKVKAELGLETVLGVKGHWQLFKYKGAWTTTHYKNGCIIFIKGEVKPKQENSARLVKHPKTGEMVPAIKDHTKECSCGDSPVVAQTGLCAVCTWGELSLQGGVW